MPTFIPGDSGVLFVTFLAQLTPFLDNATSSFVGKLYSKVLEVSIYTVARLCLCNIISYVEYQRVIL